MTADEVRKTLSVSRETISKFEHARACGKMAKSINLMANSALADIWQRHIGTLPS